MGSRIYEAALMGDVPSLESLLQQDATILDRAANDGQTTPLHIASLYGHLDFACHILDRKPELARVLNSHGSSPLHLASAKGHLSIVEKLLTIDTDLCLLCDQDGRTPLHAAALKGRMGVVNEILSKKPEVGGELDSEGSSPLHLASAYGHEQTVEELLRVNSDMCFVRDQDGRTPLHTAAMKGHVGVVRALVGAKELACWVLTDGSEPILHLCVNHNRFESAKMLLECVHHAEFVNMKDDDDNSILHLAVAKKHIPMVDHLITQTRVDVNARNVNGFTALDVLQQSPYEVADEELQVILTKKGARSANEGVRPAREERVDDGKWLDNTRGALMIVAILIATVTFQSALNPPGGVWQDTTYGDPTQQHWHFAGEAVLSYRASLRYSVFVIFNGIGFVASLLIILLLLSELPRQQKFIMRILTVVMWVAVSTMLISYAYMSSALTSNEVRKNLRKWINIPVAVFGWVTLFGILFAGHIFRWTSRYLRRYGILKTKKHSTLTWKEIRTEIIFTWFTWFCSSSCYS